MSTIDERVRGLITQEAADWFVANRAGLTPEQGHAFAAWLKASPVHVEEYLTLSVIARDLRQACEDSQSSVEALLARARLEEHTPVQLLWPRVIANIRDVAAHRWQTVAVTMAAIGALTLGLFGLRDLRPIAHISSANDATALYLETRHGEQQTLRLADNSILHLNTDSSVVIRYRKEERLVVLTAGEADFEVAHEADRKFRVFAGAAEVVAIGTKFDVRMQHDSTKVTVVEGRVAVGPSPMAVWPSTIANPDRMLRSVQLDAGEQINVVEGEWPAAPIAIDTQRATAWLQRRIIFEHEPLERVASEINRYAPKPIEITSPALRKLEISGVFATDDIESFIAFLRSLKDVRVEVTETRIKVSQD